MCVVTNLQNYISNECQGELYVATSTTCVHYAQHTPCLWVCKYTRHLCLMAKEEHPSTHHLWFLHEVISWIQPFSLHLVHKVFQVDLRRKVTFCWIVRNQKLLPQFPDITRASYNHSSSYPVLDDTIFIHSQMVLDTINTKWRSDIMKTIAHGMTLYSHYTGNN